MQRYNVTWISWKTKHSSVDTIQHCVTARPHKHIACLFFLLGEISPSFFSSQSLHPSLPLTTKEKCNWNILKTIHIKINRGVIKATQGQPKQLPAYQITLTQIQARNSNTLLSRIAAWKEPRVVVSKRECRHFCKGRQVPSWRPYEDGTGQIFRLT